MLIRAVSFVMVIMILRAESGSNTAAGCGHSVIEFAGELGSVTPNSFVRSLSEASRT